MRYERHASHFWRAQIEPQRAERARLDAMRQQLAHAHAILATRTRSHNLAVFSAIVAIAAIVAALAVRP